MELCAKLQRLPADTRVLLRSPNNVSTLSTDGPVKMFALPLHVKGGPSVCKRVLSLVQVPKGETLSVSSYRWIRLVSYMGRWVVIVNLPSSKWLPPPTNQRSNWWRDDKHELIVSRGISALSIVYLLKLNTPSEPPPLSESATVKENLDTESVVTVETPQTSSIPTEPHLPEPTTLKKSSEEHTLKKPSKPPQRVYKKKLSKPPQGVYKKGYWITSDDMMFIMSAMLGHNVVFAATSSEKIIDDLSSRLATVATVKDLTEEEKKIKFKEFHWKQWYTQITNTGKATGGGDHWILTSVFFSDKPQIRLWEPLKSAFNGTKRAVRSFRKITDDVVLHITKCQKDGWSCGYITVWWAMYNQALNSDGAHSMDEPDCPPHEGWSSIVWLLLEARDIINLPQNYKLTAHDLNVSRFLQLLWNGKIDIDEFVSTVKKELKLQIKALHDRGAHEPAERQRAGGAVRLALENS